MSERSAKERWAEWALRVGIAGEFFGHGAFALLAAPEFSQILERLFAVDTALAASLLRVFGILDLCIAVLVLVRPLQAVLLWATAWGFLTAFLVGVCRTGNKLGGPPRPPPASGLASRSARLVGLSILGLAVRAAIPVE